MSTNYEYDRVISLFMADDMERVKDLSLRLRQAARHAQGLTLLFGDLCQQKGTPCLPP